MLYPPQLDFWRGGGGLLSGGSRLLGFRLHAYEIRVIKKPLSRRSLK
jgi:hypothetical protein